MIRCRWCKDPLLQQGDYAICVQCDKIEQRLPETNPPRWWRRKKDK